MIITKITNVIPDGNGVRVFVDFYYLDDSVKSESYIFDSDSTFTRINDFILEEKITKEENLIKAQELATQLIGGDN